MSENILIEMPIEMRNRITSKAHMEWSKMTESKEIRKYFIDLYEKLCAEKYFAIERAKASQEELLKEMEKMKDKIIKLQAPCQ